jgi:hypothetical protein
VTFQWLVGHLEKARISTTKKAKSGIGTATEDTSSYLCFRSFPTFHTRESAEQALLPPGLHFSTRKDFHERFNSLDSAVVDLKRFPHRELVPAARHRRVAYRALPFAPRR